MAWSQEPIWIPLTIRLISPSRVAAFTMTQRRTRSTQRPRAATTDVLGGAQPNPPVPAKWKKHFNQLIRFRNCLVNRQNDLIKDAAEEQPTFSLHIADAGTDSFDRDFALSRISSEQDAVYEVDEAVKRIHAGTYGKCELTGKPIEPERLDAIPWARFSAEAEKELEKEGAVRRARLAPREALSRGVTAENEAGGSTEDEQIQRE